MFLLAAAIVTIAACGGLVRAQGQPSEQKAESFVEQLTLKGHTDSVYSVCFSPDGKRILSGSADNTVKVWDATSGQEQMPGVTPQPAKR